MTIKEIAFVAYPVTDVARARAFYEGILGLKPSVLQVKDNQNAFIEYGLGANNEHCLVVGAGAPMFRPGKTGATAALEVDDLEAAARHLAEHRIPTLMPRYDGPVCAMILVEDPDGNQILIHQRKPRPAAAS